VITGLAQDFSVNFDLSVFCSRNDMVTSQIKPIYTIEMFKTQRVSSSWSASNKSVFEKVNEVVGLPNADLTEYVDEIINKFCFEKTWTQVPHEQTMTEHKSISPHMLLEEIEKIEKIKNGNNEANRQLLDSIIPINELAAKYALYALKHLAILAKTQS